MLNELWHDPPEGSSNSLIRLIVAKNYDENCLSINVNNLVIMKKKNNCLLASVSACTSTACLDFQEPRNFHVKDELLLEHLLEARWQEKLSKTTPRTCLRARAHRLPRLSHSRQQVRPRLSYALKVSQPTHWIYICLEVSVLVSAQPLICHAMTFKYIKIFAVNHLRAFMSESEHVMLAINEYQCCTALLH